MSHVSKNQDLYAFLQNPLIYQYPAVYGSLKIQFWAVFILLIVTLINEAMVTGCMIIPVTLVVAVLFCHRINLLAIKVTAFIGAIFGITNMIVWFILNPAMWVMGVLHLPLLIVSVYVLILCRNTNVR